MPETPTDGPAPLMSVTALPGWFSRVQRKRALRVLLSDYVLNGASCAMGMLLVSAIMHAAFGAAAAATATVGVIATLAPDMVGPRRGKLAYMIAAPLIGMPLFLAVQLLRADPVVLGVFMVGATFVAFLGMAWGKRGAPVAIGVMLAVIFALSTPPPADVHEALARTLYGALGSFIYVLWSVLSNLALNARYRTQRTADLLLALAALMRAHALRIAPDAPPDDESDATGGVAELLRRQAALADQLQAARDVVLESPRTPHRQRLAGMLMVVLEMRDYLVAGELDLERVRHHAGNEAVLAGVADVYRAMAADVSRIADALLLGRKPVPATDHGAQLAELAMEATSTADELPPPTEDTTTDERRLLARLLRGVAFRVTHQNRAVLQLSALARGEAAPDLDVVRNSWRLFVSPTDWSLQPFLDVWHWHQPALRHALRAALAVGTGYVFATLLPWGSHDYWVTLTIVVVLRGSLAQTLERRNQRVAGTLVGSLLATGLLALHPGTLALVLILTAAQGVAHAFALRRYVVTAVAASVLGLVQSHMLHAGGSTTFALFERVGDTLLGAGIAWAFSYVLPSWERGQLARLVRRTLKALGLHARLSLELAAVEQFDTQSDLAWRLARREAYDALSALVQATQRSLVEPRAVQPPLALLEHLQGHSYQLMGQLSAVRSMLVLRRDQLRPEAIAGPLATTAAAIEAALAPGVAAPAPPAPPPGAAPAPHGDQFATVPEVLPDPFQQDVSPWLLRRLHLSQDLAGQVQADAQRVLASLAAAPAPAAS